jgi:glycosyltransferase involved in cell wall biosynthesis
MSRQSLISIIIPAFNAERFLAEAIEGILVQEIDPLEVVVVDDGSTDRTAEIAASYDDRVRCISQANKGLPAARNRGLAAANGEFIGFCDADDVFLPGSLKLQLGKLLANPGIDLVVGRYGNEMMVDPHSEQVAFAPVEATNHYIMSMSVSLIRRQLFDKVGQFDEVMRHCDDWDWFMRAREQHVPMLFHTAILMRRRLHDQNMTRNQDASRRYTALMLKRSLDRRRNKSGAASSLSSLSSQTEQNSPPGSGR